jgi:mono/diheme cytochrome c family protein
MPPGRLSRVAAVLLAAAPGALSHDVITTKLTWNREISRMVYKRCASCHRDGGTAMSLLTYDEARPWAKAIRDQVVARSMPPWGAVKGVGSFQNDPSLTEVEIQMIVAWVDAARCERCQVGAPACGTGHSSRSAW